YGQRVAPTRVGAVAARLAAVGYAVPGAVIAVAIYVPLVWVDRRLITIASWFGADIGLLFTGTILGLVGAYVVRFHAQAYSAIESRMSRIHPHLDDAARALGADRARVLTDVHLPLLWPGIVTAALLVTVEVIKELPATALLRPLGRDTLAIMTWEATKDSRFDTAALPALLIVLVGLVPVVVLVRRCRRPRGGTPPVRRSWPRLVTISARARAPARTPMEGRARDRRRRRGRARRAGAVPPGGASRARRDG